MRLEEIIPDFSKMSEEEIQELIRTTRRSRTTAKTVTLTKRPTKVAEKAKKTDADVLGNISAEQLSLLKKMFS